MQNLSLPEGYRNRPIICFDLDGTLLNERDEIHPADRRILAGENESVLFIPATGRTLESIKRTLHRNGLFEGRKIPLPLVLQNGSLLYGANEALQSFHPFANDVQKSLINAALQFKKITFLFMDIAETHILSATSTGLKAAERYEFTTHIFSDASRSLRFSKVMCIPEQPGDLAGFPGMIESLPLERAYSTPTILELTPRGVDKGFGVRHLTEGLNLSPRLICAAGDGENDLSLCDLADVFFAPTSALEQVKTRASRIIDVNNNGLLQTMLDSVHIDSAIG